MYSHTDNFTLHFLRAGAWEDLKICLESHPEIFHGQIRNRYHQKFSLQRNPVRPTRTGSIGQTRTYSSNLTQHLSKANYFLKRKTLTKTTTTAFEDKHQMSKKQKSHAAR
jgi:hypothetical protein